MNRSELVKVLSFISGSYLSKFKYPSEDRTADSNTEESWMIFLKDHEYKIIMAVLKDYIPNNPEWPPTVGQIMNYYKELQKPKDAHITAEEAWDNLLNIIRTRYSKYKARQIEEGLPDRTKRAVRSLGGMDVIAYSKQDDPFPRKNFIESYNAISNKIEHGAGHGLIESIKDEVKQLGDTLTHKQGIK